MREYKIDAFVGISLKHNAGTAVIVGEEPEHQPYINVYDPDGALLASIGKAQMNRIVRGWLKATRQAGESESPVAAAGKGETT